MSPFPQAVADSTALLLQQEIYSRTFTSQKSIKFILDELDYP